MTTPNVWAEHLSAPFTCTEWELSKITSCSVTSEAGELQGSCLICDRRSTNDWQDPLLVLVDEYLVDFLLKDDSVEEHCLRSWRWTWRLLLRDRGAKTSGLTEGIRVSAPVKFCSQLGANVRCPKMVTMSFVKETLPNLIIRPLLDPYRYKHPSHQGFPLTRHEQAVLQHNDDER